LKKLSPTEYLNKALTVIQTRALKADSVDWKTVRAKCLEMTLDAKTTADTYPAIKYALSELKDYHSFLRARVRYDQFHRLLESYNLIGMPREKIIALLGHADSKTAIYRLAGGGCSQSGSTLEITYQDDTVKQWRISSWAGPGPWVTTNVVWKDKWVPK
jgi:hypothetical protein